MSIPVKCEKCGKSFAVPDSLQGKQGSCPCGAIIDIPQTEASQETGRQSKKKRRKAHAALNAAGLAQHQKKDNAGVWLGVGAGVVAIIVIILVITLREKETKPSAPVVQQPVATTPDDTPNLPVGADARTLRPMHFIPNDTTAIGFINYHEFAESRFAAFLNDESLGSPVQSIDIMHDAAAIFVVRVGSSTAAVATGAFDAAEIHRELSFRGQVRNVSHRGYALMQSMGGGPLVGVLGEDSKLLVAGDFNLVRRMLDASRDENLRLANNSPLLRRAIAHRNSTFWLSANADAADGALPISLKGAQSVTASGKLVGDSLDITMTVGCAGTVMAKDLADSIRQQLTQFSGLVTMLIADANDARQVARLLETVDVKAEDKSVTLAARISRGSVEAISAMMKRNAEPAVVEPEPAPTQTTTQQPAQKEEDSPPRPPDWDGYDPMEGRHRR